MLYLRGKRGSKTRCPPYLRCYWWRMQLMPLAWVGVHRHVHPTSGLSLQSTRAGWCISHPHDHPFSSICTYYLSLEMWQWWRLRNKSVVKPTSPPWAVKGYLLNCLWLSESVTVNPWNGISRTYIYVTGSVDKRHFKSDCACFLWYVHQRDIKTTRDGLGAYTCRNGWNQPCG